MKALTQRTYFGINVMSNGPGYALRYFAYTTNGKVAADTLAGIKKMIKENLIPSNR